MESENSDEPIKPEIPTETDELSGNSDEESEETSTELTTQDILEKNLGIVKFFDFLVHNSLSLIHQRKLIDKYNEELVKPIIGDEEPPENADRGRMFLRDEYNDLHIEDKVDNVLETAEEVAEEHGVKTHLQRRIGIWSIVVSGLMFGAYIIVAWQFSDIANQILIPIFLVACLAPQLIRYLLTKRWQKFVQMHEKEVIEKQQHNIDEIKIFIQDVLDDTRDRLLNSSVPLERVQFILHSPDYQNVKFIRNQGGGRQGPVKAVYQFEYPEGMGPASSQSYGKSGIPEDDANDEFILLQNVEFNEEGELVYFSREYATENEEEIIESLLNASKFEAVKQPELVMPKFEEGHGILCSCGIEVDFTGMKTCRVPIHNNFEFYLLIGKKCDCGKNPFALLTSPGNKEIPESLKQIFE